MLATDNAEIREGYGGRVVGGLMSLSPPHDPPPAPSARIDPCPLYPNRSAIIHLFYTTCLSLDVKDNRIWNQKTCVDLRATSANSMSVKMKFWPKVICSINQK